MKAILVIAPAWVGDMVMAQSLFMSLRRENPEVEIDVVAPDWSRPLLDRMPEVLEEIPVNAVGKTDRTALKRMAAARHGTDVVR